MRGLCPPRASGCLVSLNLVALTAQSALMPLGDTVTLAVARADGLDYGRIRVCGARSALSSPRSRAVPCSPPPPESEVLPLVLGASALVLLACLAVPDRPSDRTGAREPDRGNPRLSPAIRRFWIFVAAASALQASHQVYYGFGTLYWRSLGFSEVTIGLLWAEGVARRDRAVLAGPAPARATWAGRIDGARGRRRHPALEPRGRGDLAAARSPRCSCCTPSPSARATSGRCISCRAPCRSRQRQARKASMPRCPRASAAGSS